MSLKRWAAAAAAGILLVICMPVSAIANETDECSDAGLISSLLGRCGLLGGLGGSDPADEDPDAVDTTAPGGPAGTDDSDGTSGGPSGDTSGNSTGPDDSGGLSGTSTGSSDPATSTAGTAGTSDATSGLLGTRTVGTSPADPPGIDSGAQYGGAVEPSKVVGALSELPDAPHVAGPVEDFAEAAGRPRVAETTGPVVGVALTLITAGIFVAITGLWMAVWRSAGRAEA